MACCSSAKTEQLESKKVETVKALSHPPEQRNAFRCRDVRLLSSMLCDPNAAHGRNNRCLRQVPQDLHPFHGRVSADLVHADENGCVLGRINRDDSAES